jgi:hypothetical protein
MLRRAGKRQVPTAAFHRAAGGQFGGAFSHTRPAAPRSSRMRVCTTSPPSTPVLTTLNCCGQVDRTTSIAAISTDTMIPRP